MQDSMKMCQTLPTSPSKRGRTNIVISLEPFSGGLRLPVGFQKRSSVAACQRQRVAAVAMATNGQERFGKLECSDFCMPEGEG